MLKKGGSHSLIQRFRILKCLEEHSRVTVRQPNHTLVFQDFLSLFKRRLRHELVCCGRCQLCCPFDYLLRISREPCRDSASVGSIR
jgi:hypothetical protein